MAQHKVRTTIQPDVELTVDDAELQTLRAQGLLVKDPEQKQAARRAPSKKED
jgi:hypothetical protein